MNYFQITRCQLGPIDSEIDESGSWPWSEEELSTVCSQVGIWDTDKFTYLYVCRNTNIVSVISHLVLWCDVSYFAGADFSFKKLIVDSIPKIVSAFPSAVARRLVSNLVAHQFKSG